MRSSASAEPSWEHSHHGSSWRSDLLNRACRTSDPGSSAGPSLRIQAGVAFVDQPGAKARDLSTHSGEPRREKIEGPLRRDTQGRAEWCRQALPGEILRNESRWRKRHALAVKRGSKVQRGLVESASDRWWGRCVRQFQPERPCVVGVVKERRSCKVVQARECLGDGWAADWKEIVRKQAPGIERAL